MGIVGIVKQTIKDYSLIEGSEKIAVALSGGKDSTSALYILKELGYNVCGLMIDLHLGEWSRIHRKNMKNFCRNIGVPFEVIDLKEELGQGICFIKAVLKKRKNLTGCAVCGVVKKWLLNRGAKRIGAKKLATGHNLDDEVQNVLMNFLKGNIFLGKNSGPIVGACEIEGFVRRIKPLFFVHEEDILAYARKMNFEILYDKCPCAYGTYRVETREWAELLSREQKQKIVRNFLRFSMKERVRKIEVSCCKSCGEPSKNELCNACKIFAEI